MRGDGGREAGAGKGGKDGESTNLHFIGEYI